MARGAPLYIQGGPVCGSPVHVAASLPHAAGSAPHGATTATAIGHRAHERTVELWRAAG